jgi:hypothetical protein
MYCPCQIVLNWTLLCKFIKCCKFSSPIKATLKRNCTRRNCVKRDLPVYCIYPTHGKKFFPNKSPEKISGHRTIMNKVKYVLYTHFPEHFRLWNGVILHATTFHSTHLPVTWSFLFRVFTIMNAPYALCCSHTYWIPYLSHVRYFIDNLYYLS